MGFPSNGRVLIVAAVIAITAAATPAAAASFDCSKARTADEKAICDSRTLSDLDVEMATLYNVRMEIPMLMGSRGAARDAQHAWLAERGTCGGNVACLTESYRLRIAELKQTISAAMHDYCRLMGICG